MVIITASDIRNTDMCFSWGLRSTTCILWVLRNYMKEINIFMSLRNISSGKRLRIDVNALETKIKDSPLPVLTISPAPTAKLWGPPRWFAGVSAIWAPRPERIPQHCCSASLVRPPGDSPARQILALYSGGGSDLCSCPGKNNRILNWKKDTQGWF